MIIGILPVGGQGKRLGLAFDKELLPLKGYDYYYPVIQHSVEKMEQAGAQKIIFVHGQFLKTSLCQLYSGDKYFHVCQFQPGFARVLEFVWSQKYILDDDVVLFGLPDTVYEGNSFIDMVHKPGIVCGIFYVEDDSARLCRLDKNLKNFDVKQTFNPEMNSRLIWGVLKFDGKDIRKMIEDNVFSATNEIGDILNRYPRSWVLSRKYVDLGTWKNWSYFCEQWKN